VDEARGVAEITPQAGGRRILYTSHMGSSPTSLFLPMVDHAATEEVLRDSGVAFTSLRNGFYAASALMMLGDAVKTGVLAAPEDGPVSWTAHPEVAAIALSEEVLDGITPALTASEALDLEGIAALASELVRQRYQHAISSPIQDERFSHLLHRQGSKQRHVGPIIAWNLPDGSLSSGSVGIQRRHGNMGADLIEKHHLTSLLTPGCASSFVLYSSYEGLFFRVQPRTALARLMLAGLTRRPWLAANSWQCSSRVASGWVSTCALKFACNATPILAGRPGIALGKT
jgi:hypothetical protein